MKHLYKFTLSIVFFVSFSAFGQEAVSVTLNASPFQELVRAIEQQTAYRFFYRPDWTDSVTVTVTAEREPVDKLLNRALEGTNLHYSIIEKKIYITRERQLLTELPIDFFNQGSGSGNTIAFDFSSYEKLEMERKKAEEKIYSIGTKTKSMTGKATLTGYIKDIRSGEALIGATVFAVGTTIGVATDQFGHYSIDLPRGQHQLQLKSVGMKPLCGKLCFTTMAD